MLKLAAFKSDPSGPGVDLEIVGISVVSSFFKIMGLNSLLESTRRIQLNIYLFY